MIPIPRRVAMIRSPSAPPRDLPRLLYAPPPRLSLRGRPSATTRPPGFAAPHRRAGLAACDTYARYSYRGRWKNWVARAGRLRPGKAVGYSETTTFATHLIWGE